jgi:hypothetical protein
MVALTAKPIIVITSAQIINIQHGILSWSFWHGRQLLFKNDCIVIALAFLFRKKSILRNILY